MAPPTARAALLVEREGQPPRRYLLDGSTFRIGRATTNDLLVPESHVSKQHAEVHFEHDGFVIVDCDSRAGVTVNDEPVKRRKLVAGDRIELGVSSPVRILFEAAPAAGISQLERTLTGVFEDQERSGMGRLARFFEFSRKLGGGFSLDEVLTDVVDLAVEVMRAERGMLLLRRPDGSLEMRVARSQAGKSLPTDGLKLSETLVNKAFQAQKPSVVEDVNLDSHLSAAESIMSLELRSAVTLPLLRFEAAGGNETATSRAFGLLYLDSRRQRSSFDGFDLRILERLAQDAGSVIENARLLEEAEEKKRIAREVEMAREVQAALMPEQFVSTEAFQIAGICVPCHDLGGDYVDQFELDGGRQALVVADVCGKGIAASLLAATLQGALAAEIVKPLPLGEIVARVNRVHCRLAPIGKFITMVVAMLEPDGRVQIVNAGHCPVLHTHANGVSSLEQAGMGLGLDADAEYESFEVHLKSGDSLLLYTDGVGECEGVGRELFGDQRLVEVLTRAQNQSAADVLAAVNGAIDAFRGDVPVSDDVTMLVVRRT